MVPTPRLRPHLVFGVLFLLFAVIELWSPIFHGGYFLPGDLGQTFTITRVASHPSKPQNPLTSDVYDAFGPFLHFDVAQVNQGHLPTWNPFDANGQPYLADAQTVVLSPFTLPFYFLSFRLALIAAALARLWLLGFVTYVFLARHRIRSSAAAVGGALFAYAGYHLVWLDYQTHVSVSATLPVALWCLKVALDQSGADEPVPGRARARQLAALVGLAVSFAVMIFDGHPETAVFDTLLVVGYGAITIVHQWEDRRTRLQWALRLTAVAALGIGLSAVQLLPFLHYSNEGGRTTLLRDNPAAQVAGYLPSTIPIMAFPNLFGGPQLDYYDTSFFTHHFPQVNYAEVDGNTVGLVAICLTPLGLVACLRRRQRTLAWFGLGATVLGSVFLYTRFIGLWWHYLPVIGTAVLTRSDDIQIMGIAVLGTLGVGWMLDHSPLPQRRHKLTFLQMSFTVVTAALLLGAQGLRHSIQPFRPGDVFPHAALAVVRGNLDVALYIAVGFAAVLAVVATARWAAVRSVAAIAMVTLAFAANGLIMAGYNTTVPSALAYPRTPAVRHLIRTLGPDETLFTSGSFPIAETNLWFGVHDIGSYDGIGLAWHDALYEKVFHLPDNPQEEQLPHCIEGLQLFGVQWVVGGAGLFYHSTKAPLIRTKSIDHVPLYSVTGSNLVGVVGSVINSSGGDGRALAKVSSCSFHNDYTVVLDHSAYDVHAKGTISRAHGATTLAQQGKVIGRTASGLTVRTTSPTPAWLVIRESYESGWTATVDGHAAPIERADVAFQAVHVGRGTHVVHLVYRSSSVSTGLTISLLSTAVAGGLGVLSVVWWRRAARPEPVESLPTVA